MSKLEVANRFFFQWFFVRLTRCQRRNISLFNLTEVSILPDGNHGIGGKITDSATFEWFSIQGFILPLTGWNNDTFKVIGPAPWFLRVTKRKIL